MSVLHELWRRRVSLLASGALDGAEERQVRAHVASCAACAADHAALARTLALLAHDPARTAEMPGGIAALQAGVAARLATPARGSAGASSVVRAQRPWLAPLAAAAAVALALWGAQPRAAGPVRAARTSAAPMVPEDMLQRMETQMAREHAARYLSEAQDVLVTVAARPRDCDRVNGRVDVSDEARRSRELLARQALLVEMDRAYVANAHVVLKDVERVLERVAALESCARAGDLDAIHREIEERRLLMKMDLMERELAG